jgi:hypothetical protein
MRRRYPLLTLALAACGRPVYTRTAVVYAEPPRYVYVAPIDRVVVRGLTEVRDLGARQTLGAEGARRGSDPAARRADAPRALAGGVAAG